MRQTRLALLPWLAVLLCALALAWPASAGAQSLPGVASTASQSSSNTTPALDLTSPRQTVVSFTDLAAWARDHPDADAWGHAADALTLPDDVAPARGPALAKQLAGIIGKLGAVDPDPLPTAEEAAAVALPRYTFFPDPKVHAWVREQAGGPPPASITLAPGKDGKWRFTAETVAGLGALAQYTATLDPDRGAIQGVKITDILGPTFQNTRWWQWAALLALIFLGLLVGKLAQSTMNAAVGRMEKHQWDVRAAAIRDGVGPIGLLLITLGLNAGLQFIAINHDLWDNLAVKVLAFLYLLAIGWFLYNLVDVVEVYLRRLTTRTQTKVDDMVIPLVRKSLRIFLVIVFTLVVAQNIFELDITGWLAGLGIAGLAISLAAQDSLKNLFGSLTVFVDKPFAVGEFITFQGVTGTVEEIGFRSTRLRTFEGHLVTMPNMKFTDNEVENIAVRPYIRRVMDVTITYDTPPDKIKEAVTILREILHDDRVVQEGRFNMDKNPPQVSFNELNSASLNIRGYYWYQLQRDPDRGLFTYLDHCTLVNQMLFERYAQAGIDFAIPTQTLYLAGDPKRELSVTVRRGEGEDGDANGGGGRSRPNSEGDAADFGGNKPDGPGGVPDED